MKDLISSCFYVSADEINKFRKEGFLHLKNIFSEPFVSYIYTRIEEDIAAPVDKYQSGFSRIKFDLFDGDPHIECLLNSEKFRKIMKDLTDRNLIYTQALGFELKKRESKGFPWHIGTQSFGYQRAEDYGCTIWTPLVPIKSNGQRGGMAYVPKNAVSGEFMYDYIDPAVFNATSDRIKNSDDISLEEFVHLRDGPLNDPAMKKILDYYAVEDDFEVGDALIFDKHVIHRSVVLEEGSIDSRKAFVMRFVGSESKYDKKRAHDLEIPRKHFNYAGPTSLHLDVCKNDGDLIAESPIFSDDIETRLLK